MTETITPEALSIKLAAHQRWRRGEEGGERLDLTGADLTGAVLTDADLTDADLTGADLTDADLTRADLTGADLTGAVLTGADLTGADLTDADLTGAVLTRADLTRADLTGADLTGAVLTRAVGIGSWYATAKADLYAVLDTAPAEAPAVLTALEAGRVDGSTYTGECACLVGTIAHARGIDPEQVPSRSNAADDVLSRDSTRPAEVWFMQIRQGDTPSTSPICAMTAVWVRDYLQRRTEVADAPRA